MQKGLKKYLLEFGLRYKFYIFFILLLCIAGATFDVAVKYKIKDIIDEIASNEKARVSLLLGIFAFYKFMHHGVYFILRIVDIVYRPKMLIDTVSYIYNKTAGHSLHWFDSHMAGEISKKISDFQQSIGSLLTHCAYTIINVMTILISLFFLIQINFISTIILGTFVLIYTPVLYILIKKQLIIKGKAIEAEQKTIGIINDSIANIFAIKIIGSLAHEIESKLSPALNKWRNWELKTMRFDTFFIDNADTIMVTVMSVVQIYVLILLYKGGSITAGSFTFVAIVTLNTHGQLNDFLHSLLFNINPAVAKLKASYTLASVRYDIEDKEDAKEICDIKGEIIYENVEFSYGNSSKKVLKNFNLNVKPGERVGIVGTSGAGKTTLVKCLLRYFDVKQGAVKIDSYDIRDVTQESLRKHISIIPQDIAMFHRSVRENLQIAKRDATDTEIIIACKRAKIHDDIIAMENGYDSTIGEHGVKLSGGQRQRVAIARAILKDAPIVILDEATSNLDTPTEALIQESINDILSKSKSTVLAIAHRLSTLKNMDRIIVMKNGNIVEEGTHNFLIRKKNGEYKKLWEMQAI